MMVDNGWQYDMIYDDLMVHNGWHISCNLCANVPLIFYLGWFWLSWNHQSCESWVVWKPSCPKKGHFDERHSFAISGYLSTELDQSYSNWSKPRFPECVAKVPVSFWGFGGWGCVRQMLRNRPHAFAWGSYGRAYGEFCKRGRFWRFQASRSLVSRGRRGTSWHSDVFCNVSKVVLCGRRNTLASFPEDAFAALWGPPSSFCVAGAAL